MQISAPKRQFRCRRAVTLVEILVVLAVIMILCTLGFWAYFAAIGFGNRLENQTQVAASKIKVGPESNKKNQLAKGPGPGGPGQPPPPGGPPGTYTPPQPPPAPPEPPSPPAQPTDPRIRWMPMGPRPKKRAHQLAPNPFSDLLAIHNPRDGGRRPALFSPAGALVSTADSYELLRSAYLNSPSLASGESELDSKRFLLGSFITAPAGNDLVWRAYPSANAFTLHSNPGANHVIYMDFNGHTTTAGNAWNASVNGNNPIVALPWSIDADRSAFSTQERDKIIELWRMVAEDFMPFDVDVTTEDPGVEALRFTGGGDTKWGMRCVIGPRPVVSNGGGGWNTAGGIAFLPSFKSAEDVCCWAWNGDLDPAAETQLPITVSHEVGHTLGLDHDGDGTPPAGSSYYPGHGTGVTSWGPIMGAPFSINLTQWSRDTYPKADNPQDDVTIIASAANGFGYRPDDHSNTSSKATALNGLLQPKLKPTYGIIEKDTDVDYFRFDADAGPINIKVAPLFIGPNLDVKAELYDPANKLLMTSNPGAALDASLVMTLSTSGTYYVKVACTGLLPVLPKGYPTYGTLGNYRITGDVTPQVPPFATFRTLNPVRWQYSPVTQTYGGTMTIGNVSNSSLTGTFTIIMTLPHASLTVVNPVGVQSGQTYTVTYNGTIAPGGPYQFPIELRNPNGVPLLTGQNTYVTNITSK